MLAELLALFHLHSPMLCAPGARPPLLEPSDGQGNNSWHRANWQLTSHTIPKWGSVSQPCPFYWNMQLAVSIQ